MLTPAFPALPPSRCLSPRSRMTILPQDAAFDAMLNKMHTFMEGLYAKWGQPPVHDPTIKVNSQADISDVVTC